MRLCNLTGNFRFSTLPIAIFGTLWVQCVFDSSAKAGLVLARADAYPKRWSTVLKCLNDVVVLLIFI